MVKELVQRVFSARNCTHLQHWNTSSYAEHMALGDFYDEVIDLIDSFVEAYQGSNSKIGKVEMKDTANKNIVSCLEDDAVWIAVNREKISGGVAALENILDEITDLYLKTIYKLKFLK